MKVLTLVLAMVWLLGACGSSKDILSVASPPDCPAGYEQVFSGWGQCDCALDGEKKMECGQPVPTPSDCENKNGWGQCID